jgi:hypothetical protein
MTVLKNPNNPLRRQSAGQSAPVAPGRQSGEQTTPVGVPTPRIDKVASRRDEQNFEPSGQGGLFNPKRYAGTVERGSVRQAMPHASERMYDKSGEMNAWDKKDALAQTAYLLNHVTANGPVASMSRKASAAESESKRRVLAAAMSDPTGAGFALVGQELAGPIKAIIDYEGFARKLFRLKSLAQGELWRIAKDVRATAYVVGQDGQSIESRVHGQYIIPDESLITSFPEVGLQDLYQMNYDVLDRMQDTARQEIELEEDKRGIRLIDRMAQAANPVSTFATMSLSVLEALRFNVERHRLVVDKFLLNRGEISDIQVNLSTAVDPVTQREWNLAGYVGRWLGAHFVTVAGTGVQEVVPAGTLYAVTAPDYLGEMGTRIELFSEPYDLLAQKQAVKGFGFIEQVGFGAPNAKAAAKVVKA